MTPKSRRCCRIPKTFTDNLLNILVLVWKKRQSVSHVVPLPLRLTTRKPGYQLLRKLFRVLFLSRQLNRMEKTFSMKDMRNLTMRFSESSSSGFLSDDKRLKMSVKPLYIALSLVESSVKNILARSAIRRSSSSKHFAISPSWPLTLTWPAKIRKVSVIRHVFLTDVSLSLSRR